jgi:hypothetical protein
VGEISCLKVGVAGFIDRLLTSLSEYKFAGNNIPNPGTNMVMHSEVGVWSKCEFGGSQFELTVKLSQVAEDNPTYPLM